MAPMIGDARLERNSSSRAFCYKMGAAGRYSSKSVNITE